MEEELAYQLVSVYTPKKTLYWRLEESAYEKAQHYTAIRKNFHSLY
jgi:hypothetical protein